MTMHKVELNFFGSGEEITLYRINDEILQKFIENASSDNPRMPWMIFDENDVEGDLICFGMDPTIASLKIVLKVDGQETILNDCQDIDDFDESEIAQALQEMNLLYSSQDIEELDGDIPAGEYAIIQISRYGQGHLQTTFETQTPFDLAKARLKLLDTDNPSDFSQSTFELGLLEGKELDIRSLIYDEEEYEFDLASASDFSPGDMYLVKRDENGDWCIAEESGHLFHMYS